MSDSEIEFEHITQETITAGNKSYKTDRLHVTPPHGGSVEINHIEQACPNCAAIGELAIELRTESLLCPICDFRTRFHPTSHLAAGIDIDDHPVAESE